MSLNNKASSKTVMNKLKRTRASYQKDFLIPSFEYRILNSFTKSSTKMIEKNSKMQASLRKIK
jgi:hypothetical protein